MAITSGTKPRHYLLTGQPGVGKTTEGKKLAKRLGLPLVSGDDVEATGSHVLPGTAALAKYLEDSDTPAVIEGAQALGLPADTLAQHHVILLEAKKKLLLKRLAARGLQDEQGIMHHGADDEYINSSIDEFSDDTIPGFKSRAPAYHSQVPAVPGILTKAKL